MNETVHALKKMGLHVAMITGDNEKTARAVGREVGIDSFLAEVLPGDKADEIRRLQDQGQVVAMVGDGINDAPALTAGDLGIAMGAAGSDVAINSASIALMSDDLKRLPFLVRLSRKTRGVITQNLGFGIMFIILGIGAGAAAWLPAVYAAILHFVGSLIVVFNSARLVRYGEELDHEPRAA